VDTLVFDIQLNTGSLFFYYKYRQSFPVAVPPRSSKIGRADYVYKIQSRQKVVTDSCQTKILTLYQTLTSV